MICLRLILLSSLAAAPVVAQGVEFVWSGALQPESVRIVAGLTSPADSVRLALTTGDEFDDDAFFTDYRAVDAERLAVAFTLDELEPDTRYRYAVEVGGRLDTLRAGRFRTPEDGPFSFSFVMGACAETGSSRPVFDVIRRQRPLFFLHLGDFHYEDLNTAAVEPYRDAYRAVLASPSQSRLYRSTPIAYIWDDHDFGPNNSDTSAPGRGAAREAYQELVPHYPLGLGGGDVPIAQAFTLGRVHFVITDLRSAREPNRPLLDLPRSMMGEEQKAWFKERVLAANEAGGVIVWVGSVPWIDEPDLVGDTWGAYWQERQEIADFLVEHEVENLVMLSGDAHMIAIDDGTHSDYSTEQAGGFPVVHAAAMDRPGSVKGGPYSVGAFPNPTVFPPHDGQWVLMEVEDGGDSSICMEWSGYRTKWNRPSTRRLVRWSRCFEVDPAPPRVELMEDLLDGIVGEQ
ncbi:MAG: alkaline phosphatase D family protein [Rhodothermales bacterium]|nr:alkaline phosphatase D family protein [Rhodothermales bacterium]